MKKSTLVLLCCSASLTACDNYGNSEQLTQTDNIGSNVTYGTYDRTEETEATASTPVASAESGETIYKKSCNACHGAGVAGAPKLGDQAAWSARISQGTSVMVDHAIKGFKGDKGYMPPKGGAMMLSDDEIAMAVDYMVSQAE